MIGPAFTVLFRAKDDTNDEDAIECNIPPNLQWSDLAERETVVVVAQPAGQQCAAVGGIHALRLNVLGVSGLLVGGRVRDLEEMDKLGLPVGSLLAVTWSTFGCLLLRNRFIEHNAVMGITLLTMRD